MTVLSAVLFLSGTRDANAIWAQMAKADDLGVDHKKEVAGRLFYTAQVTPLGGVTTGADICLDHTTSNLMKATSSILDSNPFITNHDHHAKAFPVDVQIIISNGMWIIPTVKNSNPFQPVMPNMKVQNNGYIILCDGKFGLWGGQLEQAQSSGLNKQLILKLHMDLTPIQGTTAGDALKIFNGKDVRAAIWDSKRIESDPLVDVTHWYPLFANQIQWALLSDKLPLDGLQAPTKIL